MLLLFLGSLQGTLWTLFLLYLFAPFVARAMRVAIVPTDATSEDEPAQRSTVDLGDLRRLLADV